MIFGFLLHVFGMSRTEYDIFEDSREQIYTFVVTVYQKQTVFLRMHQLVLNFYGQQTHNEVQNLLSFLYSLVMPFTGSDMQVFHYLIVRVFPSIDRHRLVTQGTHGHSNILENKERRTLNSSWSC